MKGSQVYVGSVEKETVQAIAWLVDYVQEDQNEEFLHGTDELASNHLFQTTKQINDWLEGLKGKTKPFGSSMLYFVLAVVIGCHWLWHWGFFS